MELKLVINLLGLGGLGDCGLVFNVRLGLVGITLCVLFAWKCGGRCFWGLVPGEFCYCNE